MDFLLNLMKIISQPIFLDKGDVQPLSISLILLYFVVYFKKNKIPFYINGNYSVH